MRFRSPLIVLAALALLVSTANAQVGALRD